MCTGPIITLPVSMATGLSMLIVFVGEAVLTPPGSGRNAIRA